MTIKTQNMKAPPYYEGKDGTNYIYVRVAMMDKKDSCPLVQLANDEIVISPGWVYRRTL